ncbi:MAG: HD domain-containing protein [Xanthomonadaceae bacterium]|nr:HD domain-containing protein [Xanthomonadaceae bacterium]
MEIRDALHGSIALDPTEVSVVESPYFQRLRRIKQLGFAETAFPSATHTRFVHSLGAMHVATQAFDNLFPDEDERYKLLRFRKLVRLAALLHDVGHGPLSHTTESAMPQVAKLAIPLPHYKTAKRQATHEDYTLKIVLDSELTPRLDRAGKKSGFSSLHVAALIEPEIEVKDDFFKERLGGEIVDFRPLLEQLISSELDCDRMDYLRRDSHYLGVSYGQYDYDWIIANLCPHVTGGKVHLALKHRAVTAFEDFLISRFHMFLMIYFHHKSVIYDRMLHEYCRSSDSTYEIPSDLTGYLNCVDSELMNHLGTSKNKWAKRITERNPYVVLIELPSGLTDSSPDHDLFSSVEAKLKKQDIHYLKETSTSELSKYIDGGKKPLYVRYDNYYTETKFIPLTQYSDLFDRYKKRRSVSRIYIDEAEGKRFKNS